MPSASLSLSGWGGRYLEEDALVVDLIANGVLNVGADLLLDDVVLLFYALDANHTVLVKFVEV